MNCSNLHDVIVNAEAHRHAINRVSGVRVLPASEFARVLRAQLTDFLGVIVRTKASPDASLGHFGVKDARLLEFWDRHSVINDRAWSHQDDPI